VKLRSFWPLSRRSEKRQHRQNWLVKLNVCGHLETHRPATHRDAVNLGLMENYCVQKTISLKGYLELFMGRVHKNKMAIY